MIVGLGFAGAPPIPPVANLEPFGHSFIAGGGAINPYDNGMDAQVCKLLRPGVFRKLGIGGQQMHRGYVGGGGDGGYNWILQNVLRMSQTAAVAASSGYRWRPASQVVVAVTGENDVAALGSGDLGPFTAAYRAAVARFASTLVAESTEAAWTRSGTWATLTGGTYGSGSSVPYSATTGSYAEWALPSSYPGGRVVGIGLFVNSVAVTNVGVKIDGVDQPDIVIDGPALTSTGNNGHHVLRWNTLALPNAALNAAGAHTIRLTVKSGGSPVLAPNYGFVETDPADGPLFVVPGRWRPKTHVLWSGFAFPTNDAAFDAVDAARKAVHAEFGHAFVDVDMSDLPRTSEYWHDDDAHPSTLSHGIVAERVVQAVAVNLTDRMRRAYAGYQTNPPVYSTIGGPGGPAFLNSWANYASAGFTYPAGFNYDPVTRVVRLRGVVAGGSMPGAIFNLPVGLRPRIIVDFPVVSNFTTFGVVRLPGGTDGQVRAAAGNNTAFDLDGILFTAEV